MCIALRLNAEVIHDKRLDVGIFLNHFAHGLAVAVAGVDVELNCDAIVNVGDMQPNEDISAGTGVSEVYTVGDAAAPFNIAKAIQAGNDAGRAI